MGRVALVVAGLTLLSATACGRGAAKASSGRVEVIASFYPLAEAATRVGGERADLFTALQGRLRVPARQFAAHAVQAGSWVGVPQPTLHRSQLT